MDNIEDTAVLLPFDAIYHEKKQRHIGAYLRFFQSRKRRKAATAALAPAKPQAAQTAAETEEEMVNAWLARRSRKVKRLLKKIGRKL
jgi:alpha-D-ribose 1-methylphosphonate 5-triphosphate synthase subunit PhnG